MLVFWLLTDLSLVFSQLKVLLSYIWEKKRKKKASCCLSNCQAGFAGFTGFTGCCRQSVLGSFFYFLFFFPVVLGGYGFSLGCNFQRCHISTPHLQSTVWPTLSSVNIYWVGAYCPPCCATLWLVCEGHWVRANHTPPFPSLLAWACVHKVPSGEFSSPIELSLSGCCYLSETLLSLLWSIFEVPWVEANHTSFSSLFAGLLLHSSVPCIVAESLF